MEYHNLLSYGFVNQQMEEVADTKKFYCWLQGSLASTETPVMEAEEQALSTRSRNKGVYQSKQDSACRLCKVVSVPVQHSLL